MNGIPVQALIDTGSPATMILLDFALCVLTEGKKEGKVPSQWKEETASSARSAAFTPPGVTLNSYGEQRLSVIAQVPLCLSQGGCTQMP